MSEPRPRLLVVDDEPDMLDFVERVFRREYHVERALDVEGALVLLQSGPLDVLITDQRMPRRSGEELLACAAELQPDAIRIVLTGYSDSEGQDATVDAWLHKPVDSDALKAAVSGAIERRKSQGEKAR